jgi:uncharacterized protein YcgI (DUF1989 family)
MQVRIHTFFCPRCKSAFEADLSGEINPHAPVETVCKRCSTYGPKRWLSSREVTVEDTPNRVARRRSHYQHPRHGIL